MEDKQIIIDGVDVSACISFNKCNGKNLCCYDDTREDKIPFANFCVENKDCHFKQLARKTQECEELKEQLQANQPTGICETCMAKAILQNDKYCKALKEIEEIVKINCEEICGRKFEDCNDFLCSSKNILDIINKVKDSNND